jgi:hypothetical protein
MLCRSVAGMLLAVLSLAGSMTAQDKPIVALTPAEAGPDFPFQGEYVGEVDQNGTKVRYGAQIIALGKGKFRGVGYPGGLPADGFLGGEKVEADGELQGDGVVFANDDNAHILLKDGEISITADGERLGTLKKVERTSPTLGAKPPAGAVVLFDGTSADKFQSGKLTPEGLLMQGVTSHDKFQSVTLHLEFQLSFMPAARGQQRANSGCYLQGRYEVQILDSFGLEGKNNEAGGIYEISDPKLNMCYPPLAWQTYDIDFTAAKYDTDGKKTADARITVRHNGEVVQNNVALPRGTRAAPVKEGPEPGPLYLQDHGNPIRFRNIWVVAKP